MDDILDFSLKYHRGVYKSSIESLFVDSKDRFNLEPSKVQNLNNHIIHRTREVGMRTVEVPPTAADIPGWTNARHICETHGIHELEHLNAVVNTWQGHTVGILGRRAQDDTAFATMLRNSLSQEALQTLVAEAPDYTINGVVSGILLYKVILRESMVDASVDPQVIMTQLSQLKDRFAEVGYDIRKINDLASTGMSQLAQCGQESTDIKTHLVNTYITHPDERVVDYVVSLEDKQKDGIMPEIGYRRLMQLVKQKCDRIQQQDANKATKGNNEIMALQAEVKAVGQRFDKFAKQHKDAKPKDAKKGGKPAPAQAQGDGKKKAFKKDKDKPNPNKFPKELDSLPAPAHPYIPKVIGGRSFWWCTHHLKWGLHKTSECKAKAQADPGVRGGRTINAVAALIEATQ